MPAQNDEISVTSTEKIPVEEIVDRVTASNVINTHEKEVFAQLFSGPLPPPSILKEYEEVKKGSIDTIFGWAEKESEHRREMEKRALQAYTFGSILGTGSGTLFGLLGFLVATICATNGQYTAAATIIATMSLSKLVSAIQNGWGKKKDEMDEKV